MYEKRRIDRNWKIMKYELLESAFEEVKENIKKIKEKNKKLVNGLSLISTFLCVEDENTKEQVKSAYKMCCDLLKEVDGHWED